MSVELMNPAGLPAPEVYCQVGIGRGSRVVHMAGQVARAADGTPVGPGDLAAQTEQAFLNVATALAAAGASFDDVVKLTIYAVDWRPEKLAQLGEGVGRAGARLQADLVKPVTLIGVAALGEPDLLIEVDAVAVLE